MKDINGAINKSSSQDIISRDTGILLWFSAIDKETLEGDIMLYLFHVQKNTDASSDIKTKCKFLKIDGQG